MSALSFTRNDYPTLGVELELQLVDADSLALKSAVTDILDSVPASLKERVKPELMQCYLEINTEICRDVDEVGADLADKVQLVERIAARFDTRLLWCATHPFSGWQEQRVTPDPRYLGLVDLLQETARRLVTFGLHVHVGVDSGDKAVLVCERILPHLPTLLALSVNSPFWHGRRTGLKSQRSKVMENLPTAGLPPFMRNWSEYVWLVNHLVGSGFIHSIREIWWDVRPHNNFGTVEVRICDMPQNLPDVLALTALSQCLVHALSQEIDAGTYQHNCHPMLVQQNKWAACRYGTGAMLVDPHTLRSQSVREVARILVEQLRGTAEQLGCTTHLEHVTTMAEKPTGAQQQEAIYEETGDLRQVVARFLQAGYRRRAA